MRLHTGVQGHSKRVFTESWLWKKNPLPHRGIESAPVTRRYHALPTELHPHPRPVLTACQRHRVISGWTNTLVRQRSYTIPLSDKVYKISLTISTLALFSHIIPHSDQVYKISLNISTLALFSCVIPHSDQVYKISVNISTLALFSHIIPHTEQVYKISLTISTLALFSHTIPHSDQVYKISLNITAARDTAQQARKITLRNQAIRGRGKT